MAKTFDFVVRLRDQFTTGIKSLRRNINGVVTDLGRITGISAAISAAIGAVSGAGFLRGAIESAADFEEQLSKVQAVLRATPEEIALVQEKTQELGASTRFTATEAAQGVEELARAGLSAAEAVDTIGPVLALAQGNALELANAAGIVSTALNQFGLEAAESGRVADVLTTGAASAATTVEQLARGLNQAAPVAKQLGLSIEETTALLGEFANVGFRGERGGTALRNSLLSLLEPTSKFNQELERLGITAEDPIEVFTELAEKGDLARDAFLALGRDAGPALTAVLSQGTAGIRSLTAALNGSAGAAESAAATLDRNLRGAIAGLNSAFDAFRQQLVQPILEPLRQEVIAVSAQIRDFANTPDFAKLRQGLVGIFQGAATAARDFIGSIDFAALADRIARFATTSGETLARWGENAGQVFTVLKGTVTGVLVAFDAVRAGISALVASATGVLAVLQQATIKVLEAIPLDTFREKIDAATRQMEFFRDVSNNATSEAAEASARLRERLAELAGEAENVTESVGRNVDVFELAESAYVRQKKALEDIVPAQESVAEGATKVGEAQATTTQDAERLTASLESWEKRLKEIKAASDDVKPAADRVAQSTREVGDASQEAASFGLDLSLALIDLRGEYEKMGEAGAQAFDKVLERSAIVGESVQQFLRRFNENLAELDAEIEKNTQAARKALDAFAGGAEGAENEIRRLANASKLISDKEAKALASALDRVEDSAKRATQAAEGLAQEYNERLLELQGRTEELAELRQQQELQALQDRIEAEQIAGNQIAVQRLKEAEATLSQIQAIEDAQRQESAERALAQNLSIYDAEREKAEEVYGDIAQIRQNAFSAQPGDVPVPVGGTLNYSVIFELNGANILGSPEEFAQFVARYLERQGELSA